MLRLRRPALPLLSSNHKLNIISVGTFGSADIKEEHLSPGQDLIAFDSSMSERKTKGVYVANFFGLIDNKFYCHLYSDENSNAIYPLVSIQD